MASENQKQNKFTRDYTGHVPITADKGPGTFILDTIVLPIANPNPDDVKSNRRYL